MGVRITCVSLAVVGVRSACVALSDVGVTVAGTDPTGLCVRSSCGLQTGVGVHGTIS